MEGSIRLTCGEETDNRRGFEPLEEGDDADGGAQKDEQVIAQRVKRALSISLFQWIVQERGYCSRYLLLLLLSSKGEMW